MHVEFHDRDANVKVATATLGSDGTVIFRPEAGHTLPSTLTDPEMWPLMSDDGGKTFLTPEHGERTLRTLPTVFRGYLFLASLHDE